MVRKSVEKKNKELILSLSKDSKKKKTNLKEKMNDKKNRVFHIPSFIKNKQREKQETKGVDVSFERRE